MLASETLDLRALRRPKLILFDYGETLAHEDDFRPDIGYAAVLNASISNPNGICAEDLLADHRAAFAELRSAAIRLDMEIPNRRCLNWLLEKHGLQFAHPVAEIEELFWNAAAPCVPTPGMPQLLSCIRSMGIPTGVVSNMSFPGALLKRRLKALFPEHSFACVVSSADYIFRKPNPRLFEVALQKCGCTAQDTWFIGDNLRADVCGAASAGILPVHYTRDLGCAYRKLEAVETKPACIETDDWDAFRRFLETLG